MDITENPKELLMRSTFFLECRVLYEISVAGLLVLLFYDG